MSHPVKQSSRNLPHDSPPPARIAPLGRLLLATLLLQSGLPKLITSAGLPLSKATSAVAWIAEFGIGLLLDCRVSVAMAVPAMLGAVTALVPYSHFDDENKRLHFMKNVAFAGGLLQLVANCTSSLNLGTHRLQRA